MPTTRILGFSLSIVIVVTVFSSVGSAQLKRPLRWLGQGFSDGYHQCDPGPNSDYYNPYSAHNTYLYHQNPQPIAGYSSSKYHQATRAKKSVPFSVYAAPKHFNNDPGLTVLPDEPNDNSFVPYQPDAASRSDTNWQVIPNNSSEPKENQKDSAFAPRLKNRIQQRSANARIFPNRASSGSR